MSTTGGGTMNSSGNPNSNNPQTGMGRPLPKKEADLFKSVIKFYESKLYKKGIKAADAILKKFPNHGESLAMKGLLMNCVGRREEAHELVKSGLTNDMRSHVCWHVYGLLHRSDRNYNEAIKAYKQALRIDKDNLQILRDLSLLQIQMRDLSGFAVTRHTILNLKPNNSIHWLAFALAKHLTCDNDGAINVIDSYLNTLDEKSREKQRGVESSELALYRYEVLQEIPNNSQTALTYLEQCKDLVVDRTSWMFAKAKCQLALGYYADAKDTFLALFHRGSIEDYRFHSGYMCALLHLDKETCDSAVKLRGTNTVATTFPLNLMQKQTLLDAYSNELTSLFPKSAAVARIPQTLLEGEALRTCLDKYCRENLRRGVPSLAQSLRSLYITLVVPKNDSNSNGDAIPCKNLHMLHTNHHYIAVRDPVEVKRHPVAIMVAELADSYVKSLSSNNAFPGNDEEESPSTLLWTMYLRVKLHQFCGEYEEGLRLIDQCIAHTPTCVDMYELKARLLKLSGNIDAAADCLDSGRALDLQDRYINNKTAKYLLRANRETVALERIALFTKDEGNPDQHLFSMQCTWYEIEVAACYVRKGELGRALKKYMAVVKHFDDFHEDQFDFHSYCIRKVTLRAYVDVLRFEDKINGHEFYLKAAEGIIKVYLFLFDNPTSANGVADEPDYSIMTAAERKKAKAAARRKKKNTEKEAALVATTAQQSSKSDGSDGQQGKNSSPAVVDEDPNGELLLKRDPIEEAKKYTNILVNHAPKSLMTWILQYDVSIRRNKLLMALQALFKAKAIEPNNSQLFTRIVDFACKATPNEICPAAVKETVMSLTATLLGGKTVTEFVRESKEKALSDALCSLDMRIAIAKALVSTGADELPEASSLLVDGGLDVRNATADTCRETVRCLSEFGMEESKAEWISLVKKRFPLIKHLD